MLLKCTNFRVPWGLNPYPGDHQFQTFGRSLPALHHHALECGVVELSIDVVFHGDHCPLEQIVDGGFCATPPGPQGGKRPEIYNLCSPCPKDASYQI